MMSFSKTFHWLSFSTFFFIFFFFCLMNDDIEYFVFPTLKYFSVHISRRKAFLFHCVWKYFNEALNSSVKHFAAEINSIRLIKQFSSQVGAIGTTYYPIIIFAGLFLPVAVDWGRKWIYREPQRNLFSMIFVC